MVAELAIRTNHRLGVLIFSYCVFRHTRPIRNAKGRRIQPVTKDWYTAIERAGMHGLQRIVCGKQRKLRVSNLLIQMEWTHQELQVIKT